MTYLLDSNIVTKFQDADQLSALCRAATQTSIHVVEEVYDELTLIQDGDHPQIRAKKQRALRDLDASVIQVDEIFPDTPESALLAKLRGGRSSPRDLGEAASVALAYGRADFVFVCGDKNGVLSALNELHGTGERVIRPHIFLRSLVSERAITASTALACAPQFKGFGILPSWWEDWLASLSSA